jgi:ribonuclease HI
MKVLNVYIDGSCRGNGSDDAIGGIGIVIDKVGIPMARIAIRLQNAVTNNEAEYLALIWALKFLSNKKDYKINIYSDSQLVVNQYYGMWEVKSAKLWGLYDEVKTLAYEFRDLTLMWVRRENNKEANDLAQNITEQK